MDVEPGQWSIETWITVGMVALGVLVGVYGVVFGPITFVWYGLGFVVLSVFLWVGRPRTQKG